MESISTMRQEGRCLAPGAKRIPMTDFVYNTEGRSRAEHRAFLKPYEHLFRPGQIGTLSLPNRIIMAPLATNLASDTGGVTEALIDHYSLRARGGAGLIIVENCCVDYPAGRAGATQLRLDGDQFIPGISHLAAAVHAYGARVALQINHSGPSGTPEKTEGKGPVGASSVTYGSDLSCPRVLQRDEIAAIIEKYAQAALRAKKAGFDAIELHGAHAYLVAHFMSPYSNQREDEFGRDLEGRLLFPVRIIRRIKELVGRDYPLILRMSGDEFIKEGRGIAESKKVAKRLAEEGIDAFHVSAGTHAPVHPSGTHVIEPIAFEEGCRVYLAEEIKKAVQVPVITVGVIRNPVFAENILAQGKADFVALGRALVADPEWPSKARSGQQKTIRKCISCNEGCARRRLFMDLPIRCSINAEVGLLPRFRASRVEGNRKKVLVIGGGPAGMEAARVLNLRGHHVTLWEKKNALGGQLVFASVPSFKRKLLWVLDYLRMQMDEFPISYELGKEATVENILKFHPDEVLLATGAIPDPPAIPGIQGSHVKSVEDVMTGDYIGNGSKVVVMGGGTKGAEVALFLAERGEKVTVVEMLEGVAGDMDPISRNDLIGRLEAHGVRLRTNTRIVSCNDQGIDVILHGNERTLIEAERMILCLNYRPADQLENGLRGKLPRLHCVGDCRKPGKIIDAISQAYTVAAQL